MSSIGIYMKRNFLIINTVILIICNVINIWLGFSMFPISNMHLFEIEIITIFVLFWFIINALEVFLLIKRREYNQHYIRGIELFLLMSILHWRYCLVSFMWYYSLMNEMFYPN